MLVRYERTQASAAPRASSLAVAIVAAGQHEACGQALHVPLPRGGQGFVKVVDVKDHPPFRRGESTEVAKVAVAAGLDAQTAHRRRGQVRGHVERRPTVKSEGRLHHAPVTNRDQFRNAALVGFFQEVQRIVPIAGRPPDGMRLKGALFTQPLSHRIEFSMRRKRLERCAAPGNGSLVFHGWLSVDLPASLPPPRAPLLRAGCCRAWLNQFASFAENESCMVKVVACGVGGKRERIALPMKKRSLIQ